MERSALRKKCNEYLNRLKDMHNIAKEEFDNTKSESQKRVAQMLIVTVDACTDSFQEVFGLDKISNNKNIQ